MAFRIEVNINARCYAILTRTNSETVPRGESAFVERQRDRESNQPGSDKLCVIEITVIFPFLLLCFVLVVRNQPARLPGFIRGRKHTLKHYCTRSNKSSAKVTYSGEEREGFRVIYIQYLFYILDFFTLVTKFWK